MKLSCFIYMFYNYVIKHIQKIKRKIHNKKELLLYLYKKTT